MIRLIASNELRRLFSTPLAWMLLAIGQLVVAWALFTELEAYENLQAQLVASESKLGLTSLVLIPALLNGLNIVLLMAPLLTMRAFASDRQHGQLQLLQASPARSSDILLGKYLSILLVLVLFWLLNLITLLSLNLFSGLDLGKLLVLWSVGLLALSSFVAIGLWFSSLTRQPLLAAFAAYGLLLLLQLLPTDKPDGLLAWFSIQQHLQAAQNGLLATSDLLYFILLSLLFLSLTWVRLSNQRIAQQQWSARLLSLLILVCLVMAQTILSHFEQSWDLSRNAENSVTPATRQLLRQLDGPISMTVYVTDNPLLQQRIQRLLLPFRRELPRLTIQLVDPQLHPEASRTLGIRRNGEILVRYNDRQQLVKQLTQQQITETIRHLQQRDQGWIINLQGHGEADLLDNGPHGLSLLTKNLQARGYLLQNYDLARFGQLPNNTRLVMIAAAEDDLQPVEQQLLQQYLNEGGNLLWLSDNDKHNLSTQLPALPLIEILPGVIVDAAAAAHQLDSPDNAVVSSYGSHPITNTLTRHSIFPRAAALQIASTSNNWQAQKLLQTGSLSWNETGEISGKLDRDALLFEQPGPLTLAYALTHPQEQTEQKAVVIGDSDFLRNNQLGRGDNLQLSLNLFYWLTDQNMSIAKQTTAVTDQRIDITDAQRLSLVGLFLFAVPLVLLLTGVWIPWRRKRR
ncbi:MAG: Gldg family protein [Chromatiales bacterium]|jgi:ABC-type transport system involved in multi-copper enzyme maturation permease subunit